MQRDRICLSYRICQHGAVLYVALIMLLLLALLGIAGMRVTTLQERMSANYRSENLAFQNAESLARTTECSIENQVNRTTNPNCIATDAPVESCDTVFNAANWLDETPYQRSKKIHVRLISPCISGFSSIALGQAKNEDTNSVYEISAYNTDGSPDPMTAADAAVDTILRP